MEATKSSVITTIPLTTLLIFSMIIAIVFTGCSRQRDRDTTVEKLLTVDESAYSNDADVEKSIDELKADIAALEKEIQRTVDAGERLGTYYRAVALRYMERDMFGLAADFFRSALDLSPSNKLIAYRLGVCTAQIADSTVDPIKRAERFEETEAYYLYALKLDPFYGDALYGLSVLYVFELDRQVEAELYLERLLKDESKHFKGMFLLAQVYVFVGRIDDALLLYDRIVKESGDSEQVDHAKENRMLLTGDRV